MARDPLGGIFVTQQSVGIKLAPTALAALGLASDTGFISCEMCQLSEGWLAVWYRPDVNESVVNRYIFPPQQVLVVQQIGVSS